MTEGTEEKFDRYMERMMEAMLSIAEDTKAPHEWRVHAGRVIDSANDTVKHMTMAHEVVTKVNDSNNGLKAQIKKLKPRQPWEDEE